MDFTRAVVHGHESKTITFWLLIAPPIYRPKTLSAACVSLVPNLLLLKWNLVRSYRLHPLVTATSLSRLCCIPNRGARELISALNNQNSEELKKSTGESW